MNDFTLRSNSPISIQSGRNPISNILLFLLLFSPLLSYYSFGILNKESSTYYFQLFIVFYTIAFVLVKRYRISLPKFLYFQLFYLLYIFIWSFYNGGFEQKGFLQANFRDNLAIVAVIVLVYNISYSHSFIHLSIRIMKITVVLAFLTSIYQVFNPAFFDATPIYKILSDINMDNIYQIRRSSIFGFVDMNEIGLSFLPLLSVLIGYLTRNNQNSVVYMLMGVVIAALSNTRYVIVGVLFIFFHYYIQAKVNNRSYINYVYYAAIIMISGYILLDLVGYNLGDWFALRLFAEGSVEGNTRIGAIANFLIFFPREPFLGTGVHLTAEIELASRFVGSSQIHIGYLSHLVSYGVVGSILLFSFWFLFAKHLFTNAKVSGYYGSFIAFMIFLWANASLVMYSVFYYGLIFAMIFDRYYQETNSVEERNIVQR